MTNVYVKNLLLMVVVFLALVAIVLIALKFYTKQNESVSVPPIKGLQVEEAAGILKASSLGYEVIDSLFVAGGIPGAIVEQIPKEESSVKRGRIIFLVVQAKNVQMVAIPELKDFSQRQAEAQLNSLGFTNIVVAEVPSQYRGIVVSIEYKGRPLSAGQKVPKGSTLRLLVGSGGAESQSDENQEEINVEKPFFE